MIHDEVTRLPRYLPINHHNLFDRTSYLPPILSTPLPPPSISHNMEKTGRTGSVTKTSRRHSRHQNGEKPMELSSMPNYATASSKEDAIDDSDALVNSQEETHQYLSGFKLFAVMFCITLAGFLLLLDTSVVSTVSWPHPSIH